MKATTILALASSASAQYFGIMVSRSGSPIHLTEVNANGQRLCKSYQCARSRCSTY